MVDVVKIFALGGLDENGKNMYVIEINNDIFILEAGMKYPESNTPGIDLIVADFAYLKSNYKKVKGYIITHGHDDSMGALPYIYKEIPAPIYCTKTTAYLIQECTKRFKQNVKYNFKIVKPTTNVKIENRRFAFFSTAHSVSESFGVAIDTTQGWIVYTGDYIIDTTAFYLHKMDLKAITKIMEKPVLCLMTESGSADRIGFTAPNHRLTPHIETSIAGNSGRTFIAIYGQNLFGIREVIDVCLKNNKKICFYNKDLETILNIIDDGNYVKIPPENLIDINEVSEDDKNVVIILSNGGDKLFHLIERLSIYSKENRINITPKDLFIMAAPSVPGTEVLAVEALDMVYKTRAKVVNIKRKSISSMHPSAEDLKLIISLFNPKYYFPVKGEYRNLIANANVANSLQQGLNHNNILVYDNGMVAKFENGEYKPNQTPIPTGELLIDGLGLFDIGNVVINDRNKLKEDGVILLGATVDMETKEVIAGPDVQMRGLIFLKDADDLVKVIADMYEQIVKEVINDDFIDYNESRVIIRDRISKYIKKETGKDPMILSMIIEA